MSDRGWGRTALMTWRTMRDEEDSISYQLLGGPIVGMKVWLSYTIHHSNGENTALEYPIELISVPCRFGGFRYWFICPLVRNGTLCGRRVGALHLPPGGKHFGCRRCYQFAYRSQTEYRRGWSFLSRNAYSWITSLQPSILL